MKRLYFLCGLLFAVRVFAESASAPTATDVVTRLDELKATLAAEVTEALKTKAYNASYTTVWRNFEDDAEAAFRASLKRHIPGLTDKNFDTGQAGSEKNRLADLAIKCGNQTIEVSIKASRRGQNSENDMGTFRDHPIRKKLFVASFTLWGRYDDSGSGIKVDRVFFDRTWRFVGRSTLVDGVKYRKKDGNMRPKPWSMFESGKSYWNTEEEFEAAVDRSEAFRAKALVNEYLKGMNEEDQRLFYEQLKEKFNE